MAAEDDPVDPGFQARRRDGPGSLAQLLGGLLRDVRDRTGIERMVAVAGADGQATGRAIAVPEDEVDAFVDVVIRSGWVRTPPGSRPVHLDSDSVLATLRSFRSATLVPAMTPGEGVVTAVVVDAPPDHAGIAEVGDILKEAAPLLSREAELTALRARVREMTAQQLRASRALHALPDPVLVMDRESRILLANRRAEELLVTVPDDSRGRRHAVETNNLFFSAFRARTILDPEKHAESRELLLVDPDDGSDLLSEVFMRPFYGSGSVPEGSVFVLRDITDLKQATHELEVQFRRSVAAEHRARLESERLNVIIDNAGVPIFVTDRQTNVMLMNREAERILNVGARDPGGSSRVHDIRANDTRLAGFLNEFLLHSRPRREGRLTLVDPQEGREFPALVVSTKIHDERNEPIAVVTVLHDLTQEVENRHLAEELRVLNTELEERVLAATRELAQRNAQLEAQQAELERASRMKSEFLATMSHELRTPINAVLGYNTLLKEGLFGPITEKQEDGLERMKRAAEHLLSLVNDILDLSRVEAGKIQVNATDIELTGFLEKLSESVRPLAAQKSLDYRVEIDPDVPAVHTDGTRLRQVLLNLLSNAVKFTDAGSVTLRAAPAAGGGRVVFEVADTGIGIADDDLESIFDAFTQADQSVTREHGGTGLGLAISRKLIGVMGGSLTVSSTVGDGSTFTVELPLEPPGHWSEALSDEAGAALEAGG